MHKMKEGYGDGELTLYPTQVFSVKNWALKPNQPEEPPFTDHMLAMCVADRQVVFKAPKTSSKTENVSKGTKPGAKPGHKKLLTSKQPSVSSKEATKGGSSKAPTSSKTGHSKKRKESSLAMDSNPSQPPVSTHVDTEMHKEDQQATSGPTSLEVISKARANPQLSSGMSAFNLNKPIYSASFIIHSKSVSGNDASAISTAEADPGKSAPRNFSQKHKLELEKNKVEAALLKAQPSFPNVGQLKELLCELKTLQWELPAEFLSMPSQVEMVQAKLKTLDALQSLLNKVTNALNQFAQAIASKKTRDTSVPSAGQASTQPAEGEKNTNQATNSQLFQIKAAKDANL
ncbi:hypothetical protein Tco_0933892, partial [Tanacetum coccineum]